MKMTRPRLEPPMDQTPPFDVNEMPLDAHASVEDEIRRIMPGVRQTAAGIVAERQDTHGDFRTNARLSQRVKNVFRSYDGWEHLDDVEKEVIDMIALKLSRILSGKSLERQHWEDIEGYAHLAVKECK